MSQYLIYTDDSEEEYCINGYISPNTKDCICYPGWDSVPWSLYKCTFDLEINITESDSNKHLEKSNEEGENSNNSFIIYIFLSIFLFFCCVIVACVFLCFYSKWKKIKLIKQKIKYEKEKTKKLESENSLNKGQMIELHDLNKFKENSNEEKEKNDIKSEKDSIDIQVQSPKKNISLKNIISSFSSIDTFSE